MPGQAATAGVQPVQIHSCGHRLAMVVAAVPPDLIHSGLAMALHQRANALTQRVENSQLNPSLFLQGEWNLGGRIKGIGIILIKSEIS